MMKTIAILLFSALALTGCATDADVDNEIEKPTQFEALEPAVKAWAEQFVNEPRPFAPTGAFKEWAEEIILGERLYTLLHGKDDQLLDALGHVVITIPCNSCDREQL